MKKLSLRKELLTELGPDQLAFVAGGNTGLCGGTNTCTCSITACNGGVSCTCSIGGACTDTCACTRTCACIDLSAFLCL